MKRKWIFGIIIFLLAGLILVGVTFVLKDDTSDQWKDNNLEQLMNKNLEDLNADDVQGNTDGDIIKGTIVRVDDAFLLVNISPYSYRSDLCELPISDNTIMYVDGIKSDITKIKIGQTIEATYSGEMLERYPGVALDVTKIYATTEDVSLIEGIVIDVDNKTLQIQYGNDNENICKMSISKETLVCMQGFDYGIASLEVGQNVEVVYKEGTNGELPNVTIVLVK